MEKMYDLDEVSKIIGVTRRTLYTWIKDGKLKTVQIGRKHKVSSEELTRITSGGLK